MCLWYPLTLTSKKELFSDNREGRSWSILDYKMETDPTPTNIPLLGLFQYRSNIIDEPPFITLSMSRNMVFVAVMF